jgi:hypothetical protein
VGTPCAVATDDAGHGRAAARCRRDFDAPSDVVDAILDAGQARAVQRRARVEAAARVVDAERQFVPVASQPERHGGAAAGKLGRGLGRLEAAQVDRISTPAATVIHDVPSSEPGLANTSPAVTSSRYAPDNAPAGWAAAVHRRREAADAVGTPAASCDICTQR